MHCNSNTKGILVLAEHRNGAVDSITFQLAAKGRELADRLNCELSAALLGYRLDSLTGQLQGNGFEKIFVADSPLLELYNPEAYTRVISDLFKAHTPAIFLMGHTYLGMELAPSIATKMGVNLISNCVNLEYSNEQLLLTRPMFGGAIYTRCKTERLPLIVSVQKDALPSKTLDQKAAVLAPIDVNIDPLTLLIRVTGILTQPSSGIDITKADVLVAVGQGIGKQSGLDLARELAQTLNGTLACSRPLAQWGWLPPDCYVGISGKAVRPKIYIACGISGAPQHIAGMRDSGVIIAINNDAKAPIFQVAHYGIVGNINDVLPVLIKTLRDSQRSS